jgi:hypothetical protein
MENSVQPALPNDFLSQKEASNFMRKKDLLIGVTGPRFISVTQIPVLQFTDT